MEAEGGGPGSQARCSRHSTLTHNKNKIMIPTTSTVASMQHQPPGQGPPRSTTTNTYKYLRFSTSNVQTGRGGCGSQARCNRHDNINKKTKRPSQPLQAWLSACSIRPRGNVHLVPPQQIPINTQDATHPMWRREGAGLGHRHDAAGILPSHTIKRKK